MPDYWNMSTPKKTKPIPLRFSEEDIVAITQLADRLDSTKAAVIRLALNAGITMLNQLGKAGLGEAIVKEYRNRSNG